MTPETLRELVDLLRLQAHGSGKPVRHYGSALPTPPATWPSGISSLDSRDGGFARLSVIAGAPKLGKSQLALRSALEAARAGWRVFYFDAENPDEELARRMTNYFSAGEIQDRPDWYLDRFTLLHLGASATLFDLSSYVAEHLCELDERALIVLDSANRLAKRIDARSPKSIYFRALGQIVDWAAAVGSLSHGMVGVLLLWELNRKGEAVGMDVEYSADRLLYVRKEGRQKYVTLDFSCRSSEGGYLGAYRRDYTSLGFVGSWTEQSEADQKHERRAH